MFRTLLRSFGFGDREFEDQLRTIDQRRQRLFELADDQLKSAARVTPSEGNVVETFALTAVIAERVLGLHMFDVQIQGALALQRGHIAEMQTGEGKTLAAVPAVIWYARQGRGTHVLTANDYLARRDAMWMRGIYDWFGLSVAHISQNMPPEQRRAAYLCDVTYATANEVGFDYLRDGLARMLGGTGPAAVCICGHRRSRLHLDRRGSHPARHRGWRARRFRVRISR